MIFWLIFILTTICYSLTRIWFFYWHHLLSQTAPADWSMLFMQGLRFDLSTIAILAFIPGVIWLWNQKNHSFFWLNFIFNLPFLFINLFDVEFVNFTGRRFTADALFNLREVTAGNAWGILAQYWVPSLVALLIMAFYFLVGRFILNRLDQSSWPMPWPRKVLGGIVSFLLLVIAARGGVQPKPLNHAHAQVFLSPAMNQAVLNSGFTFIQSLNYKGLNKEHFMSEEQMVSYLVQPLKKEHRDYIVSNINPFSEPQNVVVIILESFSFEHMGDFHNEKGWTPFLDQLADKSLFFTQSYANARRSIEGITAILAGIPALTEEPFVNSPFFASTKLSSLGNAAKTKNYHTSFFHGGNNGTMYFDVFTKAAGFDNYFGAKDYPNPADHDGSWGIYDEPFLQWMLLKLNTFPKPMVSTVFTLSSHHPFKVPDQYKGQFAKGPSEIHEAIGYTDWSLRRFFEAAAQQPWYKNTLFVITADHTFKIFRNQYNNELGKFRVPLIFFHPMWNLANLKTIVPTDQPVQHIDILPSLLDFLKIENYPRSSISESVFNSRFSTNPRSVLLGISGRSYLLHDKLFSLRTVYDEEKVFSVVDPEMKMTIPLDEKSKDQLNRHRAYLQYYSEGLWSNTFYR
jgi:phosphoglycerol transferase MdoB-like AlkP superfamily enzyme